MQRAHLFGALLILCCAFCNARAQTTPLALSVRIQRSGDGLPQAALQRAADAARSNTAAQAAVTSVVVNKLQSRPEPWRVQVRSKAVSLDPSRAYTWRCQARASQRTTVKLNLIEPKSGRTYLDMEIDLGSQWQTISMQTFQAPRGVYELQAWLGGSLGTFSFRGSELTTSSLDRGFLSNVDDRIRQHRQGKLRLTITDSKGADVAVRGLNLTLTRHAFVFGTAIEPEKVQADSPEMYSWYLNTIKQNFWSITPENLFKWNKYEPQAGDYQDAFTTLNELYITFAQANKMELVRGHALDWGESYKKCIDVTERPCFWALQGYNCDNYVRALKTRVMRDVALFKGKFTTYDVFNEPIETPSMIGRCNLWNTTLREMFSWARSQDGSAELCLNEWAALETQNWQGLHQLVQGMQKAGVPITCLNLQAHLTVNKATPELMWWRLNRLASLGLPIYISEFSLNNRWDSNINRFVSTLKEDDQSQRMQQLVKLWFSHPAVKGITLWGFWDGHVWNINGGIFRADGSPKPAALALRKLWQQQWNTTVVNAALPGKRGSNAGNLDAINSGLNSITGGQRAAGRRLQQSNTQECLDGNSYNIFTTIFGNQYRPCDTPAPTPVVPAPVVSAPAPNSGNSLPASNAGNYKPSPNAALPPVGPVTPTLPKVVTSSSGSSSLEWTGYYGKYQYELMAGGRRRQGTLFFGPGKDASVRLQLAID